MPRLTSFSDIEPETRGYDFELRSSRWDQVTLFRGTDRLATVRSQLGAIPPVSVDSDYDLTLGRTTVRRVSGGDVSFSWLAVAELAENGTAVVCIEVARPGVAPISSEARLRYRLWSHHAIWAIHDLEGRLVMTAHRAWRDSEAERNMVGGLRICVPLGDEDARLTAIAASFFWFTNDAVFSLQTA